MIYRVRRFYSEVFPELNSGAAYINAQVNEMAENIEEKTRDILTNDSIYKPRGIKKWLKLLNLSSHVIAETYQEGQDNSCNKKASTTKKLENKNFNDMTPVRSTINEKKNATEVIGFSRQLDMLTRTIPSSSLNNIK